MDQPQDDFFGNDTLSEEEEKILETEYGGMLKGLHEKVKNSDAAKQWLNTDLGVEVRKFIAADKMRSMKVCSTSEDETEVNGTLFARRAPRHRQLARLGVQLERVKRHACHPRSAEDVLLEDELRRHHVRGPLEDDLEIGHALGGVVWRLT